MVSCEEVGLCQRNLICTNFIYAWSSRLEWNVFSIPHNNFTDTQKSKESLYDMDNRENNFCIFSHMNSLTDEDDSWSEEPELTWQIQLEMKGPSIGIEGLQLCNGRILSLHLILSARLSYLISALILSLTLSMAVA